MIFFRDTYNAENYCSFPKILWSISSSITFCSLFNTNDTNDTNDTKKAQIKTLNWKNVKREERKEKIQEVTTSKSKVKVCTKRKMVTKVWTIRVFKIMIV